MKETPRRRITVTSSLNGSTDHLRNTVGYGLGGEALLRPPPSLQTFDRYFKKTWTVFSSTSVICFKYGGGGRRGRGIPGVGGWGGGGSGTSFACASGSGSRQKMVRPYRGWGGGGGGWGGVVGVHCSAHQSAQNQIGHRVPVVASQPKTALLVSHKQVLWVLLHNGGLCNGCNHHVNLELARIKKPILFGNWQKKKIS